MADTNQQGAKPAQAQPTVSSSAPAGATTTIKVETLSRRDQFAIAFGAAMLSRQTGSAHSIAAKVVEFTDKFLEALDSGGARK